jgi:hypothetical protein
MRSTDQRRLLAVSGGEQPTLVARSAMESTLTDVDTRRYRLARLVSVCGEEWARDARLNEATL